MHAVSQPKEDVRLCRFCLGQPVQRECASLQATLIHCVNRFKSASSAASFANSNWMELKCCWFRRAVSGVADFH